MRGVISPLGGGSGLAALLLVVTACGGDAVVTPRPPPAPVVEAAPEPGPRAPSADALYDAEGALLESEEIIAGLTLPRGLTLLAQRERHHSFESRVPRPKLVAYFGPRLFTGAVEPLADGAIYRAAIPRGVREDQAVKLDVSIVPASNGRTRVEIHAIPPLPADGVTTEERLRRYREKLRYDP
ncbi:MAG: hypothetical protein AAF447_00280 [Myxococcota bacterium]